MKTSHAFPKYKALAIAVHSLVLLMAARGACAEDATDAVAALTHPASSVEIGAIHVDRDSAKFGEYNGLDKAGTKAIGNIDIEGGSPYDSDGTTRFRLQGRDLGTRARSAEGEYAQQGRFRFGFSVDELQHNMSDTYRTPLQGVGGSFLTLPSTWLVPVVPCISATTANARGLSADTTGAKCIPSGKSAVVAPTAAQNAIAAKIQNADLPSFQDVDLYTRRLAESASFAVVAGPHLDFAASLRHEKKDGYKPMGAIAGMTGADIVTILPDPIKQKHDQYTLAANYHEGANLFSAEFYGSHFRNDVDSVSWQNWAGAASGKGNTLVGSGGINTISSAPSNDFHQLSLTGSHDFAPATHLVAKASYGRGTQNASFVTDATDVVVPARSLNGEVITKEFNLRLTSQVSRDLGVNAAYRYDLRDNRSPINTYQFSDAQETPTPSTLFTGKGNSAGAPALLADNGNANVPYSRRTQGASVEADYRLTRSQAVKLGYDASTTERWCNGVWITCAETAKTRDNTVKLGWRSSLLEDLSGRIDYAYAMRRVGRYNEDAFLAMVPYAGVRPNGASVSALQYLQATGLTAYGPFAGYVNTTGNANVFFPRNNVLAPATYGNRNAIYSLPGLRQYNQADRNRDLLKAALDWQASDRWNWQGSFEYRNDDFFNSTYGLKQGSGWALNLESTFMPGEHFSATGYVSWEEQRQQIAGDSYNANATTTNVNGATAISGGCFATVAQRSAAYKTDPCMVWSNDMRDRVDTVGASFRQTGLFHDRLQLSGDVTFSRARTDNFATGGNYVNNPLASAGGIAAFYIPASNLPTVTTDILQMRLNGAYRIDKASSVSLGLGLYRIKSSDYAYDALQPGGQNLILPDYEQAPNATVHSIAASYRYQFE